MRKRWKNLHPWLRIEFVFTAIGSAFNLLLIVIGAPIDVVVPFFLLFTLVMPMALIGLGLPVLIHELGHLIVARRLGMKVVEFDVLRISFVRGAERLPSKGEYFGYVKVETTLAQDSAENWTAFLRAGPIAGFLGAGIEAIFGIVNPAQLGILFGIQATFGVALSLLSLLGRDARARLDGQKIVDVRRSDSQVFASTALRRLLRCDLEACDPEDIRRSLLTRDPARLAYAKAIVCYRALLNGGESAVKASRAYFDACEAALRSKQSRELLDHLRSLREDAIYELAFSQALFARDVRQAEETLELLDRVEPESFQNAIRVDAALSFAKGDLPSAKRGIERAHAHLRLQSALSPHPVDNVAKRFIGLVEDALRCT